MLFTVASLLCGFANGETWLIVARGAQGLGAALVSPAALSIITTTFREGPERAKALGVWAAIAVGGGAVGLLLGGILVETLSWPWIFFVNVPVGIATFFLSLRFVPESKDEHAHKSFDLAGATAVTGGLIALVYGIVRSAESGWGSGEVLGILAVAVVLLGAFVLIEQRSVEPLVRLSIFSVKTVRGANVAMFVVAAGLFAMFFFNTLYVQRVLGYSPLEAGLAFLPFTLGIIIGAGLAQPLLPRLGPREVPVIGSLIAAAGLLLFLRLSPDSTYLADLLPGIMLASIGMGLVFVPVTLIATSGVPVDDAGLASGLFNTAQQIGGALGLALLTTLATNRTEDELQLARPRADPGRHGRGARLRLPRDLARQRDPGRLPAGSCSCCSFAAATSQSSRRARSRPSRSDGSQPPREATLTASSTTRAPRHRASSAPLMPASPPPSTATPARESRLKPSSQAPVVRRHPRADREGDRREEHRDPDRLEADREQDDPTDDRGNEGAHGDEERHRFSFQCPRDTNRPRLHDTTSPRSQRPGSTVFRSSSTSPKRIPSTQAPSRRYALRRTPSRIQPARSA